MSSWVTLEGSLLWEVGTAATSGDGLGLRPLPWLPVLQTEGVAAAPLGDEQGGSTGVPAPRGGPRGSQACCWPWTQVLTQELAGPRVSSERPSSASLPPGTSLLQEVVYLVSQGADPDEIGLMNIDEQLPVLEYPQPGLDIIKELTSPRLIKSHLPYRFLPSDLHNGDSKVIYMARNPKDLVVSYYQFHRSLRTMSYRGTFQEFCRRFMNDKLGYGSWFEHVQEFWEHRMDSNVLFLKYEDMHRDLVTMVEQLARFLGVSCDKAQLESLTEHCHQLVDQCCNAEALPVGRGRVGLWKDIFTVSMNEKFDLVYKQKMGKCDLTFDFYL
nr:sulfotransferase 4A1 [Vicugna pacos]